MFELYNDELVVLQPTQNMCETLQLFRSWQLGEEIISILIAHDINTFVVLKKIEMEDIQTLLNKLDKKYFGELIKFKSGLRIWRNEMNIPFICAQDTLSANSRILNWLEKISEDLNSFKTIDSTSVHSSKKSVELPDLLKSTVKGQLILSFHEKNKYLDSKCQKALSHLIVDQYIGSGKKMTYTDMKQWALQIVDNFPKESPETYFLDRKKGSKNPTGKLFSRWANSTKISNITNTEVNEAYDVQITSGMYTYM